jgi:hypothetical protein
MFCFHSSCLRGSVDVPTLLVEVTQVREVAAAVEASRVAWDRAAFHLKDAKDRAAMVEREALERLSRVEAENTTALASTREDAEGFVQKIALLEDELAMEC